MATVFITVGGTVHEVDSKSLTRAAEVRNSDGQRGLFYRAIGVIYPPEVVEAIRVAATEAKQVLDDFNHGKTTSVDVTRDGVVIATISVAKPSN